MVRKVRQHVQACLRDIMREITRECCNSQIAHVRVAISLRSIMKNQLPVQRGRITLAWLGVVLAENVRVEISSVDTVIPPLSKFGIRTLEKSGERIWRSQEWGIKQTD